MTHTTDHTRLALWLSALLAALGLVLSFIFWGRVPDPMPIHWNAHGVPNGFGSRIVGLLLMPALTLVLPVLLVALTHIEPRRAHVSRSRSALSTIVVALSAFMFALHCILIKAARSATMTLDAGLLVLLMGALFIILGNAMPKFGSNHFIGIRTPWTLRSEKVWIKTHQLASKLFVACGLFCMVLSFFVPTPLMYALFLGATLLCALAPIFYSWRISPHASSHTGLR